MLIGQGVRGAYGYAPDAAIQVMRVLDEPGGSSVPAVAAFKRLIEQDDPNVQVVTYALWEDGDRVFGSAYSPENFPDGEVFKGFPSFEDYNFFLEYQDAVQALAKKKVVVSYDSELPAARCIYYSERIRGHNGLGLEDFG